MSWGSLINYGTVYVSDVNSDGNDVYIAYDGGSGGWSPDIYKQTNGVGSFVSTTSGIPSGPRSIAIKENGDKYVINANSDLYKQAGGVGAYSNQMIAGHIYTRLKAYGNNLYAVGYGLDFSTNAGVFKYDGSDFDEIFNNGDPVTGIIEYNSDVYVFQEYSVYKQTGGSGAFSLVDTFNDQVSSACLSGSDLFALSSAGLYRKATNSDNFTFEYAFAYNARRSCAFKNKIYVTSSTTSLYTFLIEPYITSIVPNQTITRGTLLTIEGNYFGELIDPYVDIDGDDYSSLMTYNSQNKIIMYAPNLSTGSHSVTVTSNG